jgi:hypothetical protein
MKLEDQFNLIMASFDFKPNQLNYIMASVDFKQNQLSHIMPSVDFQPNQLGRSIPELLGFEGNANSKAIRTHRCMSPLYCIKHWVQQSTMLILFCCNNIKSRIVIHNF